MERANDACSTAKAYGLRSFSIDPSLPGSVRRPIKWGKGTLRSPLAPQPPADAGQDDAHAPALARK